MLNRLRDWWEGLGRNNKVILVASSAGALVVMIGFVFWAATPEYEPLFSKLSPTDANAITDVLRESGVPYKLSEGGAAIAIPSQRRDEMRMKILSRGLPAEQGDLGATANKESSPFASSEMVGEEMRRTREREIASSIMQLKQVAKVIVRIAPENDSPFISNKQPASASVLLTLKPGSSLSDENVNAILRLVEMSYTGLQQDRIAIVDSSGNPLHTPGGNGLGVAGERMKRQREYEQVKRTELQGMLDRTVGPNKAIVLVNAELNSDEEQVEKTIVEPGAAVSKTTQTEEVTGTGANPPQTPPGMNANAPQPPGTPTYDQAAAKNPGGKMTSEKTETQFTPSSTRTSTKRGPGRIEKLTVSAMVDAKVPVEQLDSIKSILQTAIGAAPNDTARMVTVQQVAFDRSVEEADAKAANAARSAENMTRVISVVVPLALMLICLYLLARALKRAQPVPSGRQLALAGAGGGGMGSPGDYALDAGLGMAYTADGEPIQGQSAESLLNGDKGPLGLSGGVGEPRTFEIIEEAFDSHLESILHLVKSKPETVASLMKGWTSDEMPQ